MRGRLLFPLLILGAFAAIPATAQDIYDNGPVNGTTDAWTINFGFIVSNSFTVYTGVGISSFDFAAWLFPGDVLQSAELSITSDEFGGTTYFDQIINFHQHDCVGNQYGYNVCLESVSLPYVTLEGGTYWLNLQNASVNTGDPIYWDENSGPSSASQNSIGTIPSEAFTLGGGCGGRPDCGPPPPTTPEPGSLVMLGSGLIGMLPLVGRRLRS